MTDADGSSKGAWNRAVIQFRTALIGGANVPCSSPYTSMANDNGVDDYVHNYDECPPEFPYPAKEGGGYCYKTLRDAEAPPRDSAASAVGQVTMATARHSCHLCMFHFEFSLACSSPS
jgi:hypothetical protein